MRNLKGERFTIFGDGDFERTSPESRAIIAEAVRASLQSLFDGYVELGRGRTPEQVAAPGSAFFAALRSIPVFVESNPEHYFDPPYDVDVTTGNNYNGRWMIFAQSVDVLAGTNVVPNGSLDCVMRYEDGEHEIESLVPNNPCTTFPAIAPPPPPGAPATVILEQSFPNPFGASTTIRFALPRTAPVTLEVLDLKGGKVRTLLNESRDAGQNFVVWDGRNDAGSALPAGLYFYRLSFEGGSYTRRTTLVP